MLLWFKNISPVWPSMVLQAGHSHALFWYFHVFCTVRMTNLKQRVRHYHLWCNRSGTHGTTSRDWRSTNTTTTSSKIHNLILVHLQNKRIIRESISLSASKNTLFWVKCPGTSTSIITQDNLFRTAKNE